MKTSILAGALATLLVSGAYAQTTPPPANPNAHTSARTATAPPSQEAKGPWHAKDFMSSNVYNMSGEKIGDVNDIVVDDSGKVTGIVVGVGGFLGLGEKQVQLSLDRAKRMVHSDGKTYFTVNATKDELQAAPAYTRPKA